MGKEGYGLSRHTRVSPPCWHCMDDLTSLGACLDDIVPRPSPDGVVGPDGAPPVPVQPPTAVKVPVKSPSGLPSSLSASSPAFVRMLSPVVRASDASPGASAKDLAKLTQVNPFSPQLSLVPACFV